MAKSLIAYSIKQKSKVPFKGKPEIIKTENEGRTIYRAAGVDDQGNKMSLIMSAANATQAIKDGVAVKGAGW